MIRLVQEFGLLGWTELCAALAVAVGCLGELWILANKLTRHVEPLSKSAGLFWRLLARADSLLRPIVVRFKLSGRRLPEVKEELIERVFVMLVAIGVSVELVCLMFSLHETAKLNEQAGKAIKLAAEARERTALVESNNAALLNRVEESRSNNLTLQIELRQLKSKLAPRTVTQAQAFSVLNDLSKAEIGPVRMDCQAADAEATSYMQQLASLLRRAGYPVNDYPGMMAISGGGNPAGLHFTIFGNPPPAYGGHVVDSFIRSGIVTGQVDMVRNTNATVTLLGIVVGPKPL